ncbi:hypothetical protein ACFSJ3_15705 [Corallincola platygyrae]|uniref:Uncharacterized protein n=1 Tax=Corallincola platygyrae TaxID=1193278 RepID=A0ABW4XUA8_9GAMM
MQFLKVSSCQDFFFGSYQVVDGYASLNLSCVNDLSEEVAPSFFVKQLNRLLAKENGQVALTDPTSCPEFSELIEKIPNDDIGKLEIYSRTDLNPSVDCTLACKVYLEQGILDIRAQWCAYKEMRADEIFTTLVTPIYTKNLEQQVFIEWGSDERERLASETKSGVMSILTLARAYQLRNNPEYVSHVVDELLRANKDHT